MMARHDSPKRVAVFAPLYPPAYLGGGPIRSIKALVDTAPSHVRPLVVTRDRDLGASDPLPVSANEWLETGDALVYYASVGSPRRYWRALNTTRRHRPDILHVNSFMNPLMAIVPLLLYRLGFWGNPIVLLAPRGEFGAGALRRRATKKRIYLAAFRLLGIHRSVIWHSTAPHETKDIQRIWGRNARIIERGNDTLLPIAAQPPGDLAAGHPLRAMFLGRIVEHKGLAIALEALLHVGSPVKLDIYGTPEDAAYLEHCEALAARLPQNIEVAFHGVLAPDNVVPALNRHDVLLMPTAGENFGHVIAEALSGSCIVAATPDTPWTATLQAGGGIVVADRSPRSWARAIEELATEGFDKRHARRLAAGGAYNAWATRPRPPHIWSLALEFDHPHRSGHAPDAP